MTNLFTPDDVVCDPIFNEYAKQLFKEKGFCIIKNFLDPDMVNGLLKVANNSKYHSLVTETGNVYSYFYSNRKRDKDSLVLKVAKQIGLLRNSIGLQSNADQHLRSYCWRFNIAPEDGDGLHHHQQSHSYVRINTQKEGAFFPPHHDSPGEIQAVVYLTKRGKDYVGDGLVVAGLDGKNHPIDEQVQLGDLVLMNAYACKHHVEPVRTESQQIGRITLFAPIISESHPMFGMTYFFRENPLKLYCKTPNEFQKFPIKGLMKLIMFGYLYSVHFIRLVLFKSKAVDHNHIS